MQMTVRSVLALPEVAAGDPVVLSGKDALDSPVRWVHVTEQLEIAELLQGGELVLTTGLMVGADPTLAAQQLQELTAAGAAGVIVELPPGREPSRDALARAAAHSALPVIVLRQRVRFVDLTEAVHRLIVAEHLQALEASREIHESFTQLALQEAGPERIVNTAARMIDSPVLLLDGRGRVLTVGTPSLPDGGSSPPGARDDALGRRLDPGPRVAAVVRGTVWGTLAAPGATAPTTDHVLERAAQAIALHVMAERDERELVFAAQSALMTELAHDRSLSEEAAAARATALGLDPAAHFLPAVVHHRGDPQDPAADRHVQEALAEALEQHAPGALAGRLGSESLALLVPGATEAAAERALERVAQALQLSRRQAGVQPGGQSRAQPVPDAATEDWRIGAGPVSATVKGAAEGLAEAGHVADAALRLGLAAPRTAQGPRRFFRAVDVRLPGLLAMLSTDPRAAGFARSELGVLLEPGREAELALLRLAVLHGGNKTSIARDAYLSRQAVYHRLGQLEGVLGVSLSDPASLASLHAALALLDLGAV